MLMGVKNFCTQLGVTILKLTVMKTQICSFLEDNEVVCGVQLSVITSENKMQLNEIVHDIVKAITIVVWMVPIFLTYILKFRWEFEIISWELSLHIASSTPDSAKSRITRAIIYNFKEVRFILLTALHGFLVNLLHNKVYILLRRFWHELYTIVAISLHASMNHHSHIVDPREKMNISISHTGLACFLVVVFSVSHKIKYGKFILEIIPSSAQLIDINMNLTYYNNSDCVDVTKKMKVGYVCYAWGYNQEAIKLAVFRKVLQVLDISYTGSSVIISSF
ncbi:hypothetical protein MKX03_014937 [Papaver bracteatum]|nr:hypothetical protein MKX03_014937 [Papaver bracteatum]